MDVTRKSGKGILSGAGLHADTSARPGEYLCMHERVCLAREGTR